MKIVEAGEALNPAVLIVATGASKSANDPKADIRCSQFSCQAETTRNGRQRPCVASCPP